MLRIHTCVKYTYPQIYVYNVRGGGGGGGGVYGKLETQFLFIPLNFFGEGKILTNYHHTSANSTAD